MAERTGYTLGAVAEPEAGKRCPDEGYFPQRGRQGDDEHPLGEGVSRRNHDL